MAEAHSILTQLITQEDFVAFWCHKSALYYIDSFVINPYPFLWEQ